jgi:putative mRNA 3-end processing factor
VLVPAFAVGRAQEIVTMLHNHKFGYPVYLDGMAKQAAEIMFDFPEYLRDFRQMYSALKAAEWASDDDMRDEALDQPSVIVSTAGLLQGGPAIQYLFKMKDRPNQAVFFSGFQTVDSPGRLLLEQKRFKFEDFDMDYSEMLIKYFDFSAHAGVSELSRVVKKVSPKVTIVVHGEEPKAKAFAERIQAEHGGYVIVPKLGDRLNLEKYL